MVIIVQTWNAYFKHYLIPFRKWKTKTLIIHSKWHLGPISQRDLSPDLDFNLRLWS